MRKGLAASFLKRAREKELLSASEVDALLLEHGEDILALAQVLRQRNVTDVETLSRLVGDTLGVAYLDMGQTLFQPDAVSLLSQEDARRYEAICVYRFGQNVTVAMSQPLNKRRISAISKKIGFPVEPNFTFPEEIETAIAREYARLPAPGEGGEVCPQTLAELGLSRRCGEMVAAVTEDPSGIVLLVGATQADIRPALDAFQEAIPAAEVHQLADTDLAARAFGIASLGQEVIAVIEAADIAAALRQLDAWGVTRTQLVEHLRLVLAQRRLPGVCGHCREIYTPSSEELAVCFTGVSEPLPRLLRAPGCDACKQTGQQDAVYVQEALVVDGMVQERLGDGAPVDEVMALPAARNGGNLLLDALKKVIRQSLSLQTVVEAFALSESTESSSSSSKKPAKGRRARLQEKLGLKSKLQADRATSESPVSPAPQAKPVEDKQKSPEPQPVTAEDDVAAMSTEDFVDPDMMQEFLEESREHLDAIEPDLLVLEEQGEAVDAEVIRRLFRAIHSVKGASPFLACPPLKDLAHVMESLLMKFRDGEMTPTPAMVDVLLAGVDRMRTLLADLTAGREMDCSAEITVLQRFLDGDLEARLEPVQLAEKSAVDALKTTAAVKKDKDVASGSTIMQTAAAQGESIRVSLRLIDQLINRAGEMLLGRNQLRRRLEGLQGKDPHLAPLMQIIERVTSELQEDVMRMRMQPLRSVLGKFPRLIRDLSRQLGKSIVLEMEGEEVELDKSILEGLADPLTHILRNCVDHGIEDEATRRERGKPAQGTVAIDASHEGGQVVLTVCDDGAGIDPAKALASALKKGIISEDHAVRMTDKEKQELIFFPGFSTATEITDISGRGVGMDVVKTNIERLGGHVEVESVVGKGTTVFIRLPLTLAIISALIVENGGYSFAIPQGHVQELVRIRAADLETQLEKVGEAEVLRLRNRLLPLLWLDRVLDVPVAREEGAPDLHKHDRYVVVVRLGSRRYGLVVDECANTEEIVVKPLSLHTEDSPVFSGTTLMGDGRVAMILDVAGIAEFTGLRFGQLEETERRLREEEEQRRLAEDAARQQAVLVFSNAPGEHFAVPVDAVAHVTRLKNPEIERIGAVEFVRYRGEGLPLVRLEQALPVGAFPDDANEMYLILPREGPHCALVASGLVDTAMTGAWPERDPSMPPGFYGTALVLDHVTMFLNPGELIEPYAHVLGRPATRQILEA